MSITRRELVVQGLMTGAWVLTGGAFPTRANDARARRPLTRAEEVLAANEVPEIPVQAPPRRLLSANLLARFVDPLPIPAPRATTREPTRSGTFGNFTTPLPHCCSPIRGSLASRFETDSAMGLRIECPRPNYRNASRPGLGDRMAQRFAAKTLSANRPPSPWR